MTVPPQRDEIQRVAKRLLAHVAAGSTEMGPHAHRLDLSVYTDPDVFATEKELLFRRRPLLAALSSDLPEPGSFLASDDAGVPILLARGDDGHVRAFQNTCRHRGALVAEGCGRAGRLACPFHGWTYDLAGRLVAVPHERSVAKLDRASLSLVSLPTLERHGLVWVQPTPGGPIDADALLSGLGPELEGWELARTTPVDDTLVHAQANWKLAMDTFAEGYHFGTLHRNTVGTTSLTNVMTYDRFGRNHRLAFPARAIVELAGKPEDEWDGFAYFAFVYFLFPNVTLFVSRDWVYVFRLYPGDEVDRHRTRFSVYARQPLETEARRKLAHDLFAFILFTFEKEDYRASAGIQAGLRTGLATHSILGRNELAIADMHRSYREAIGRDPGEILSPLVG